MPTLKPHDLQRPAAPCDELFRRAVGAFSEARWYEAHDHFEELWRHCSADAQPAQAVLLVAVALHHARAGNAIGARLAAGRARAALGAVGQTWRGLDMARLAREFAALELSPRLPTSVLRLHRTTP
ncbi:MAG: DUF309 domain-containing protein [Planctomycetes bacterium]|nr:DUF309 domain-containing protein [Planctomycetota bacterium]